MMTSHIFVTHFPLIYLAITRPVKSLQFPEERPRRFDVRKGELILEDFGMNEKKSKWLTFSLCHSLLLAWREIISFLYFHVNQRESPRRTGEIVCVIPGWALVQNGWDLADWLQRIWLLMQKSQQSWVRSQHLPWNSGTMESEGRQMKQCWMTYIKRKNLKKFPLIPPFKFLYTGLASLISAVVAPSGL